MKNYQLIPVNKEIQLTVAVVKRETVNLNYMYFLNTTLKGLPFKCSPSHLTLTWSPQEQEYSIVIYQSTASN